MQGLLMLAVTYISPSHFAHLLKELQKLKGGKLTSNLDNR